MRSKILTKSRIVVAAFVMAALFITMTTFAEPQTDEKPAFPNALDVKALTKRQSRLLCGEECVSSTK